MGSDNGHLVCDIELMSQDKLTIKFIGAEKRSNGSLKNRIINLFSRYQGSNAKKTIMYSPFKHIKSNSDAIERIKKNKDGIRNKHLRSLLMELLSVEFDEDIE